MIEINEIFSDSDKRLALWCDKVADTNDLVSMAENIILSGVDLISVLPEEVQTLWVHLEKTPVKIFARYNISSNRLDAQLDDLVKKITNISKHGADGVQIFLTMNNFEDFIDKILPVQADLFFDKKLSIGLDIEDVDINRWDVIFQKLRKVGADYFMLSFAEDMGKFSDFAGRIYGMLRAWDFDGELHFVMANNFDRIDQAIRLIESERRELSEHVKFFLEY